MKEGGEVGLCHAWIMFRAESQVGEKGGKKNWDAEIASSVIESRDDEL